MTATTTRPRTTPRAVQQHARSGSNLPLIVGGVVVLLLAALIAVVSAGERAGAPATDGLAFGEATVDGDALPRYPGPEATDPAVGAFAPEITGQDFAGGPVEVIPDGRPKMLVFLAHWCQFCQRELPEVSSWLAEGGLPDGVDLVAIPTGSSDVQPNFPPDAWFEREGFEGTVVVDDRTQTIARSFGLSGYPYWVFLDAQHEVVSRASGALGRQQIDAIARDLEAGETPSGTDAGPSSDAEG